MIGCQSIRFKLVAGETLAAAEQAHLDGCPGCRAAQAQIAELDRIGALSRQVDHPAPEAVSAIGPRFLRASQRPEGWIRAAWAAAALLLGVLGVIGVLRWRSGPVDEERTARSVFALMDSVDAIAGLADLGLEESDRWSLLPGGVWLDPAGTAHSDDSWLESGGPLAALLDGERWF